MPIKERRTKILLLLFLMSNLSTELFGSANVNFDFIEITLLIQRMFNIFLNQKTKGTLSAMIKEELIEKKIRTSPVADVSLTNRASIPDIVSVPDLPTNVKTDSKENDGNQYRLIEKGYKALCLEFPFFRFIKEEWDGRWRIISYEIPESKREIRDRFRREMRGWGLGPWHRSFWITPHPVIENLRNLVYGREEGKYIQAFESTHVFGDLNLLVEKVWQKSKLDEKYREIFKKWHDILSAEKTNEQKLGEVLKTYVELLRFDPGLPNGLIGKKWVGFEAFSIFTEIKAILSR